MTQALELVLTLHLPGFMITTWWMWTMIVLSDVICPPVHIYHPQVHMVYVAYLYLDAEWHYFSACIYCYTTLYHYHLSLHQNGISSLMLASAMGHVEVAEMLLQHGASVDLVNIWCVNDNMSKSLVCIDICRRSIIINPQHACTARVMVLGCVCVQSNLWSPHATRNTYGFSMTQIVKQVREFTTTKKPIC